MTKAHFKDRFGVTVAVEVPFPLEDLYVLFKATEEGAKISLLCRAGKRVLRLNILELDPSLTFGNAILAAYSDTTPPEAVLVHSPTPVPQDESIPPLMPTMGR